MKNCVRESRPFGTARRPVFSFSIFRFSPHAISFGKAQLRVGEYEQIPLIVFKIDTKLENHEPVK